MIFHVVVADTSAELDSSRLKLLAACTTLRAAVKHVEKLCESDPSSATRFSIYEAKLMEKIK